MSALNESAVVARYGKVPSDETALGYLKALKVILAADGEIAREELEALRKSMKRLGVSDAIVAKVEAFKPNGVNVESVLPSLKKDGKRARNLVRDAIELSSADGTYAAAEKDAVNAAATYLGVSAETVKALQSLVEIEAAAKRLRKALL